MEKEKGPHHCDPQETQHKGSDTSKTVCRVFNLLSAGGKFSAREINRICDTNDARKCVSVLIHSWGVDVCKQWHQEGYKLFWIERKEAIS